MIDSSIFGQWIQIWLRAKMLWHSTSNFSGYKSDFGRLQSRLESDGPLKCHNHASYAYVITVPHIVYQCLILLLTGYIALTVMCNHTLILCQPKAAWSATTWSAQMVKTDTISPLCQSCVWAIHTTTVWIRCVGVIQLLERRTKSLYAVTRCSKLELTDTVAI